MSDVRKVLKLTNEMIALSDSMDMERQNPETHSLAGTVRDAAYNIRRQAQKEKERLIRIGQWDKEVDME
jgi:hypothetical protein